MDAQFSFKGVLTSALGVNYSPAVCALEGSSVNMSCSYTEIHGEIIRNVSWVNGKYKMDLTLDPHYEKRVHVNCENEIHKCHLTINNITKLDAGLYCCRIRTTSNMSLNDKQGVQLSVTGK